MNERVAQDLNAHLEAARRGEESGVAGLWHALNPLVLRYLRVVVGPQAADDVASETWLQAAYELRRFRGDADGFRVWLFRVARNRALEELRRSGRRREDPAGLFGEDDRVSRDDPAREAVERMATRRALRLIAELPSNQAEAVMLRVVVGMDVTQTAEVLGKRPGAVRVASMRGLRRLATMVGVDDGVGGGGGADGGVSNVGVVTGVGTLNGHPNGVVGVGSAGVNGVERLEIETGDVGSAMKEVAE